jgi:hypothetical protein
LTLRLRVTNLGSTSSGLVSLHRGSILEVKKPPQGGFFIECLGLWHSASLWHGAHTRIEREREPKPDPEPEIEIEIEPGTKPEPGPGAKPRSHLKPKPNAKVGA